MIGDQLQRTIWAALTAAPAIAGGRVFDRAPAVESRVFPDVTIGNEQVLDDGNSCGDGWEVIVDIHVWSRPSTGSKLEAKALAADVAERLTGPLSMPGFVVVDVRQENRQTLDDPDGITKHAVLTFRFIIDPA